MKYKLDQQQKEFEDLKESNNIDVIFAKGIDVTNCKRLLDHIKDLMVESDWHIVDKDTVNLMES